MSNEASGRNNYSRTVASGGTVAAGPCLCRRQSRVIARLVAAGAARARESSDERAKQ